MGGADTRVVNCALSPGNLSHNNDMNNERTQRTRAKVKLITVKSGCLGLHPNRIAHPLLRV